MTSKNSRGERRGLEWDGPVRTGADRTKRRATPRRTGSAPKVAPSRGLSCSGLLAAFLVLVSITVGCVGTAAAVGDIADRLGVTGRPALEITIDSCSTTHNGKVSKTECFGHGDPGSSGVTDAEWMIHSAAGNYSSGTRMSVRCTRTGGCSETGVSYVAADFAGLVFGLLFLSGGLIGGGVLALGRLYPGRFEGSLSRRGRYALAGWFIGLGVLFLVSLTTSLVT